MMRTKAKATKGSGGLASSTANPHPTQAEDGEDTASQQGAGGWPHPYSVHILMIP